MSDRISICAQIAITENKA